MQENPPAVEMPRPGPAWMAAPNERSPDFFPAFARVSIAIQTLLRERIPAHYFQSPQSYANVKTAYPMLVYQASRPFRGKVRAELCYDVLNPTTLAAFFRTVRPVFAGVLESVKIRLLLDAPDWAAQYQPGRANAILQSVQKWAKSRKCLYVLIRAEGVLVNTLIDLAGLGSLPARQQARRIAAFQKKWRFQLRRMYPGTDFTWLAPELLEAATEALLQPDSPPAELGATIPQNPEDAM
ncbi:MAG TPA: hypothetical protein VME17_24850 [Bryobacteraceae bacterium]|nr:hypothetical protein [Bryobacteraceae bacterium]